MSIEKKELCEKDLAVLEKAQDLIERIETLKLQKKEFYLGWAAKTLIGIGNAISWIIIVALLFYLIYTGKLSFAAGAAMSSIKIGQMLFTYFRSRTKA